MYSNQGPGYVFVENQGNRRFFVEADDDENATNQQQAVPQVAAVPRTPLPPLEGDDDEFDMFNPEDWD